MTFSRCLLMLSLAALLIGCATRQRSVQSPQGAEFRTGNLIEPGYVQQLDYETRWLRTLSLGEGQEIYAAKTLGDLFVIVERPENVVTALNVDNGTLAWKEIVGEPLEDLHAPVGDEENIYVNSSRRIFAINRARGEVTSIQNLAYLASTSPLLINKMFIVGSVGGVVLGHDVSAGYKLWAYGLPDTLEATPVQVEDKVFAVDVAGNYVMLRSEDGELRWNGQTYGPVTTEPAVNNDFIILASEDQSLYSLTATTGRRSWEPYRSEQPFRDSPTIVDNTIFIREPGVGYSAINGSRGTLLWRSQQARQPIATEDDDLIAYSDQAMFRVDPKSGRTVLEVPTRDLQEVVKGPGESLILISPSGELLRIDPQK